MQMLSKPRRIGVLLAAAVFLPVSCSRAAEERFGSGPECSHVDGAGLDNLMATAEGWLEVVSPAKEFADQSLQDTVRTLLVDIHVRPVEDLSHEGEATLEPIAIHPSFLAGLDWAMTNHARAFLAMVSFGVQREMVDYVIIRPADGQAFFVGECAYRQTTFLREVLGTAGADQFIDRLIGMTGQRKILRMLESVRSASASAG